MEQIDVIVEMEVIYFNKITDKEESAVVVEKPHMIFSGDVVCKISPQNKQVPISTLSAKK